MRGEGREEERESDRPRGRSHPEFEVGERAIAFRDYDVELVALSSLRSRERRNEKTGKGATERKITGSHETFRGSAVEEGGGGL